MYPDDFPPMEQLKAMPQHVYTQFFLNNVTKALHIPTAAERVKGIAVGDEVVIIFDSVQDTLGHEGIVRGMHPDDQVYPFLVEWGDPPIWHWFTWAVLKEPKIDIPQLSSIEDADRFLEQIKRGE
jgi:hypothetical protein